MKIFQHPIAKGILAVAAFVIVAEVAIAYAPPAWGNVSLPIPFTPVVVQLGDIPQWVIAVIAAAGLWKSWKAERNSATAAELSASTAVDVAAVKHETNSMREALEEAAKARGILEGRKQKLDEQSAARKGE